ncbi:MAG: nucleotide sugar dehydrogenase [Candidatus Binatia bacterium]
MAVSKLQSVAIEVAGERDYATELLDKFHRRHAVVGVIGLGYVGLPLAGTFAEAGYAAIGFDCDPAKVRALSQGRSYIRHVPATRLRGLLRAAPPPAGSRGFFPTSEYKLLRQCDGIVICVPTPLTPNREPDLSFVASTAEAVAPHLRTGQLVVLESTTYPGTTEEVVQPVLERTGLVCGDDFYLAYSPEREDPNNTAYSTRTIPKLVGGVTPVCGKVAAALYGSAVERVVLVSHARVAEAAKLLENIYRSVNIALVNELKVLFDRMGLDVWEVINAAATKPFGFTPFYPGPGLGGHCIPIDPFYLTWRARQYELTTRFIELAGEINHAMHGYVVDKLTEALNERGKSVSGSRILILGVAYKRDVDDDHESPAFKVMELLERKRARIAYHDPYVPVLKRSRQYDFQLRSVPLTEAELAQADAVVIVTDHSVFDYDFIVRASRLVVDARNATRGVTAHREKIVYA